MRALGWLLLAVFGALAQGQDEDCPVCMTNRYTKCLPNGDGCTCTLQLSEKLNQPVNCSTLTSKCWMMKNEMYRLRSGIGARRKPTEHAMLDNDGIYDPDCKSDGTFRSKQCNGTSTCWCVNTAGVRRTDKADEDIECPEQPVSTFWFQIQLRHKPLNKEVDEMKLKKAIQDVFAAYQVDPNYIEKIEYHAEDRYITVDLKQNVTVQSPSDLATAAYYLEKDVKSNTLFSDQYNRSIQDDGVPFDGEKLSFEEAYVYYVDSKNPEFSMKRMTPGIIAVIVVICLAIVAGLVVLFFTRRKAAKAHIYQKAEGRELDEIQKQQLTT
ncbi:epithelial cell adhesion molecule-like [Chiloscyllium plagiosum]|uniref:epithelial cell adhesion molecule-like n=1 Tax=Chiloscyllium plagiosum TaxID=36176 RepID=UPI001CB7E8C4|nr:epithelial cell adhesion molecule-like [Chiloscyllium plagiosum]